GEVGPQQPAVRLGLAARLEQHAPLGGAQRDPQELQRHGQPDEPGVSLLPALPDFRWVGLPDQEDDQPAADDQPERTEQSTPLHEHPIAPGARMVRRGYASPRSRHYSTRRPPAGPLGSAVDRLVDRGPEVE